jgi:hypothetical protein
MDSWKDRLNGDPVPWLLSDDNPAVRTAALRLLEDRSPDDEDVRRAREAAMRAGPIAAILDAQHPDGYWVKPGPGYAPKYTGTVWQVIFLDQLGADGTDSRVQRACEYLLSHTQAESGGFGASSFAKSSSPPSSCVIHCLNGNLLRALAGFGWLDDERTQRAVAWQARAITGEGDFRYYQSGTSGPGFRCAANEKLPCAWGAVKALRGLARIPAERRTPHVVEALRQGAEFLLGRDVAAADYPVAYGNEKPSGSWFKLGFPSGYVADLLQLLELLCELGYAGDPRLVPAVQWLLSRQDGEGRWRNEYAYNGKTWVNIERQGEPSRWVTLRACTALKAVFGGQS